VNVVATGTRTLTPAPDSGLPPSAAPTNATQLFAVAAGPLAWALQLDANYALAAYPCFERNVARSVVLPGWEGMSGWLLAINLAAIVLTLVSFALGWRAWRWSHARSMREEQHSRLIARTHALGIAAMVFAAIFFVATVFALIALLGTPPCPA